MDKNLEITDWVQDEACEEFRLHRKLILNGAEAASITRYNIQSSEKKVYLCYIYGMPLGKSGNIWDNWQVFSSDDLDVLKFKINVKLKEYGYLFNFI